MFRNPDYDAITDALALIEAAHACDVEGAAVIMDNADLYQVIAVLAVIARDLLKDVAALCDEDSGDLLGELRARSVARLGDG